VHVDFVLGDDGILHIRAQAANGKELRLEARISGATPAEALTKPLPAIQH
jgi:molecular chaperone DnaK